MKILVTRDGFGNNKIIDKFSSKLKIMKHIYRRKLSAFHGVIVALSTNFGTYYLIKPKFDCVIAVCLAFLKYSKMHIIILHLLLHYKIRKKFLKIFLTFSNYSFTFFWFVVILLKLCL